MANKQPQWGRRSIQVPTLSGREIFARQIRLPSETYKSNLLHWCEYRSLDHLLSVVNDAMPVKDADFIGNNGHRWTYGDLSQEETHAALSEGRSPSDETRKIYRALRNRVRGRILDGEIAKCRSARRKRVRSWAGGRVDVNRYLESRNEGRIVPCFQRMTKRADRPVIRIGLNVSMSCGNSEWSWYNLAANAACMSEGFEQLGYGVEIVGVATAFHRPQDIKKYSGVTHREVAPDGTPCPKYNCFWHSITWLLKGADDPLDPERVMSIGCPGLLRDVMFRADSLLSGAGHNSTCLETPGEVTKEQDLDIMMEKTWTENGEDMNADRIVGKIREVLGEV